ARRLVALAPDSLGAQLVLTRGLLSAGNAEEALTVLEGAQVRAPDNRNAFADKAIALAALGRTEEARAIADLDALLEVGMLPAPEGFERIEDFNAALYRHVRSHPTLNLQAHSPGCHHGHTSDELLVEPKGPLAVLERQLYAAAETYRQDRAGSVHPYPAMLPQEWTLSAWTTTLDRQGSQHAHIHATAHLSGVYYLSLPDSVADDASQAGWIEFGRAPDQYQPKDEVRSHEQGRVQHQGEIRTVKPVPGLLLLFPSYLYHRTIPSDSDQPRITIGFDFRRSDIAAARP
ncbi:MAG: putative 2OG-Fe(II) oxygenase, partial [Gammaproteobacteria bacterium]